MDSPRRARRSWKVAKSTISAQRNKIKNLQRTKRRLKSRIVCLNSLMSYLRPQFSLSEHADSAIKVSHPGGCGDLVSRLLKGPTRQKYSPRLRVFAATLNFYSSAAYNYVSENFNNTATSLQFIKMVSVNRRISRFDTRCTNCFKVSRETKSKKSASSVRYNHGQDVNKTAD